MSEAQFAELKRYIFWLFVLLMVFITLIVFVTYFYMNRQYAGYENDIIYRLCHGGGQVPFEIQAWTREMIDASCAIKP